MKDVKVNYNSPKPAQLQAHAYAQGTDIHVSPGQEKHLPHEAWHVVQQKQGRVKPTLQLKRNNDNAVTTAPVQLIGEDNKSDVKIADDKPAPMMNGWMGGDEKVAPEVKEAEEKPASSIMISMGGDQKRSPGTMPASPMVNGWMGDEKKQPQSVGPDVKLADPKREGKEEMAGTSLSLAPASEDKAVVDRRRIAARSSKAVIDSNKTDVLHNYKSGFVKTMRKKMVDIVKDIQEKYGQMEQADNYINGDAGVNGFLNEEAKKADSGEASEAWTKADTTPEARHQKLGKVAGKILDGKFKTRLIKNGVLDKGDLGAVAGESKDNITKSRERLQQTAADKAVVEMYYNELINLHEKNDAKNEGSSIFDSDHEKEQRENSKSEFRDKAGSIFQYGFIRQDDVKQRHAKQKEERTKLETQDRITSTVQRAWEASYMATLNVLVKTISLGFLGVKKNRDKRGFVGGFDYTMDEQTGKGSREKLKGGKYEVTNIYNDYVFARDELRAKWDKRAPMGKYAGASLILEGFRKFIDAIQSIFASLSLALTAVGLIPGVAPVVAPVIAFCSSVALAIGVAKGALSFLITSINAVAEVMNENPELFAEMSGETGKAAINTVTDGLGIGASAAWGASGLHGSGHNMGDRMNFNSPAYQTGPSLGSQDWFSTKGAMAGAAVSSSLVPKVTNAAVTASGNLDNNDMTYTQTVNENRRIGKSKHKAIGEYVDKKEHKFIESAVATTKKKAEAGASQLLITLAKFTPEPAVPRHDGLTDDKKDAGEKTVEAGKDLNQNVVKIKEEASGLQNGDKK